MQKTIRITVDAATFTDKRSVHETMCSALQSSDYTGNNLDALHDALTSVGQKTRLTVKNFDKASRALDEYADKLALVLAVSAAENPLLTVIFE